MKPKVREAPPDLAEHYLATTGQGPAVPMIPGAYQPMVNFDRADLDEILKNTEVWMGGDLSSVDIYIKRKALAIWQMLGVIATKDVKGRNGINARIAAARGWFDMAKKMKDLVGEQAAKPKKP